MDEIIDNLLLTGRSGLSLPGTLRFRFTDLDALAPTVDVAALVAKAAQSVTVEVGIFQLAGSLSVPLLTGARPVPLAGFALFTNAAPVGFVLSSTDPARRLDLLFNLLDARTSAGGMVWRRGQSGELVLSLLGTQLATGLRQEEATEEGAAPVKEAA